MGCAVNGPGEAREADIGSLQAGARPHLRRGKLSARAAGADPAALQEELQDFAARKGRG